METFVADLEYNFGVVLVRVNVCAAVTMWHVE
jgi:hypothetical protein